MKITFFSISMCSSRADFIYMTNPGTQTEILLNTLVEALEDTSMKKRRFPICSAIRKYHNVKLKIFFLNLSMLIASARLTAP